MKEESLIGIDVGTTAVKCTLFSLNGTILKHVSTPYPLRRPAAACVEQDPVDWMTAIYSALHEFSKVRSSESVRAIGLTSQVNTHVFVDAANNVLAPALVWQDGRSAVEAGELDSRVTDKQRLRWWGAPLPIDASHALARMQWMKTHKPETWQKTRKVLLPKDYCLQQLTGETVSDPLSNIGLVDLESAYVSELMELVPGSATRLAPLADMCSIAGRLKPGLPFAGVPVAVGTMDAWAGVFGTGVTQEGSGVYLSGTSEILGIVSSDVNPTPGVLVMPPSHGITLHVGPTQSGGASQLWFCQLFNISPAEMSELAGQHGPENPCPLFLPHLQGERAPLWDATARGVFLGLDASTDRAAMARAVYEGVAYSARWLLESLQSSACVSPARLNAGGGGFRSHTWNQIRSDILGVELSRVAVTDPGTLGAAGLGAIAVGLYDSVQTAFSTLVTMDRHYIPNPAKKDRHEERLRLYKSAYENTRELSRYWVTQ